MGVKCALDRFGRIHARADSVAAYQNHVFFGVRYRDAVARVGQLRIPRPNLLAAKRTVRIA